MSSMRLRKPSTTHRPPVSTILRCRRGLVARKLVGAKTSRICRAADSTMSSWCLLTPPIPVVAACHHCWFSKKAWTIRLKGGSFHAGSVNRRSWRRGSIAGAAPGSLRLRPIRSEEHTSELQSLMRISYAVFCLKKKKQQRKTHVTTYLHNKKAPE